MIDVPRDDKVLLLETGYIYLAMGKFSEAKQVFEGVSVLMPESEIPLAGLANVYFAQKKFLQAIRTLKEALKLNEQSAFVKAHLGEAYLFYGKKDDAVEELKAALSLDKDGHAGAFAKALLQLIDEGYDPVKFSKESANQATA